MWDLIYDNRDKMSTSLRPNVFSLLNDFHGVEHSPVQT